jgi:hypothetical protein
MSLDVHPTSPPEPVPYAGLSFRAGWSEGVVTVLAVGIGVLVVALIAVLMGLT